MRVGMNQSLDSRLILQWAVPDLKIAWRILSCTYCRARIIAQSVENEYPVYSQQTPVGDREPFTALQNIANAADSKPKSLTGEVIGRMSFFLSSPDFG
jgi:hypothetical protein